VPTRHGQVLSPAVTTAALEARVVIGRYQSFAICVYQHASERTAPSGRLLCWLRDCAELVYTWNEVDGSHAEGRRFRNSLFFKSVNRGECCLCQARRHHSNILPRWQMDENVPCYCKKATNPEPCHTSGSHCSFSLQTRTANLVLQNKLCTVLSTTQHPLEGISSPRD
jgi:hypothetical protein